MKLEISLAPITARKVAEFRIYLVPIFPYSDLVNLQSKSPYSV